MSLLDLPQEMLEKIASFLDGFSLLNFALSDHILERATSRRKYRRFKLRDEEQCLNRTLPVGMNIRQLNLSHLYAPASVESVVLGCSELKTLSLVNSNLAYSQLMNILNNLPRLENFCCSIQDIPSGSMQDRRVLKAQRSLKDIFMDCTPSVTFFLFPARFLNKCKLVRYLHVHFVGSLLESGKEIRNPFPAKSPRCRSLRTIIVGSVELR